MIRPAPRRQAPQQPGPLPSQAAKSPGPRGLVRRKRLGGSQGPQTRNSVPPLRDAAPKRREGPAQAAILRYLELLPGVIVWRMNSRVVMLPGKGGKPRPVRFGVKGMADILGSVPWCYPCGRLRPDCQLKTLHLNRVRPFAFEVKSAGKALAPDQETFAAHVLTAGWLYARVESVDDVREALSR